ILALTADEEGGPANGIDWLVTQHRDLIDAEYCINTDISAGSLNNDKPVSLEIFAAEKIFLSFTLEVTDSGCEPPDHLRGDPTLPRQRGECPPATGHRHRQLRILPVESPTILRRRWKACSATRLFRSADWRSRYWSSRSRWIRKC